MIEPTYIIKVDWDNNGNYTGPEDDITSDCQTVMFERGWDDEMGKSIPGRLRVKLVDTTQKYVNENTGSAIYGLILPGRPVQVRAVYATVTYDLFNGYLDEVVAEPNKKKQRAYLYANDGLDKLARDRTDYPSAITGLTESEHITVLLTRASWQAGTSIDSPGLDIWSLFWTDRDDTLQVIRDIGEGYSFGRCYINGTGNFCYENRHHRLISPHNTSQYTVTDTDTLDIVPLNPIPSVRNRISLRTDQRTKAAALTDIWTLRENATNGDSPYIAAGETKTFGGYYADSNGIRNVAGDVVTPVATTDYLGNDAIDGTGTNRTTDISIVDTISAASVKLAVTNNGATGLYLTLLKVRGKIYSTQGEIEALEEDATSQTVYLVRQFDIGRKWVMTHEQLRDAALYRLAVQKDPIPRFTVELVNDTAAHTTQILAREIGDRVTVNSSRLNVNTDFYIDAMRHEIDRGKVHRVVWTLVRASDYEFWTLGTSALGTGSRLG